MSRPLLRWASALLMALGVGHLVVSVLIDHVRVGDWLGDGLWSTIPLLPERTVESQADAGVFWGSVGSFGLPLAVLAGLIWHLAGRGVPVPAWVGWTVAGWCVLGGIMLVPSPFFVGIVPALLIVRAAATDEKVRT